MQRLLPLWSLLAATSALLLACPEEPPPTPPPARADGGQPSTDAGPDLQGLVFPAAAAACELLLVEEAGALRVAFGEGTTGTFVREAPRVAVALRGTPGDLEAELRGGAFTLESARCVDDNGAEIDGSVEVRQ